MAQLLQLTIEHFKNIIHKSQEIINIITVDYAHISKDDMQNS